MRQIMDINGGVLHSEREYDIAPETEIHLGQVVKLADGLVVPAAAGETGAPAKPQGFVGRGGVRERNAVFRFSGKRNEVDFMTTRTVATKHLLAAAR